MTSESQHLKTVICVWKTIIEYCTVLWFICNTKMIGLPLSKAIDNIAVETNIDIIMNINQ